jgi:hypothetical protein
MDGASEAFLLIHEVENLPYILYCAEKLKTLTKKILLTWTSIFHFSWKPFRNRLMV